MRVAVFGFVGSMQLSEDCLMHHDKLCEQGGKARRQFKCSD